MLLCSLGGADATAAGASDFTPGNLFAAHRRADLSDSVFEFDLSGTGEVAGVVREITDPEPGAYPDLSWGPSGMAVGGPDVDLYVASILRGTISRFSHHDGRHVRTVRVIPPPGTEHMPSGLHGLVWGPNGNLFASRCSTDEARFGPDAVLELDRDTLRVVREIREIAPKTTRCFGGIAVGPGDLLYVGGINSGNVVAFDLDSLETVRSGNGHEIVEVAPVRNIALMEEDEDPTAGIAAFTFGYDGTLYVSVGQGGRVASPRVAVVAPDATVPTGEISVGQPTGIRFGPGGHVFVGDRVARAVLEIDPTSGEIVRRIGNGRTGEKALDPRFVVFYPLPYQ